MKPTGLNARDMRRHLVALREKRESPQSLIDLRITHAFCRSRIHWPGRRFTAASKAAFADRRSVTMAMVFRLAVALTPLSR
jgi:hypothetical protein